MSVSCDLDDGADHYVYSNPELDEESRKKYNPEETKGTASAK